MSSLLCRKHIRLGLVPVGGVLMVIGSVALSLTPIDSVWIKTWIALAGAGGAVWLVPLNAYLQDVCPPEKRGRIIAGLNLVDCIAGLLAVIIQALMAKNGVPYWMQFTILATTVMIATTYGSKLLSKRISTN